MVIAADKPYSNRVGDTMQLARPIVVGIDGSDSGNDALDWAAAEAAARRLPLRIVHTYMTAPAWAAIDDMLEPDDDIAAANAAHHVMTQAATRARSVASGIEVNTCLLRGTGASAMIAQCDDAELLVVGNRGQGGFRGLFTASASMRVATNATCPVVVVRPIQIGRPGPSTTRVVVGVDGTPLSERAIDFAVKAAAQRGVGVTAIHAWSPKETVGPKVATSDWAHSEAAEWRKVQGLFSQWHRLASASIDFRVVQGRAQDVLITESTGAALVVVGSRGRGALRSALLGSVSLTVLQHAGCPVAVIR